MQFEKLNEVGHGEALMYDLFMPIPRRCTQRRAAASDKACSLTHD
jgi:hypothetical protein